MTSSGLRPRASSAVPKPVPTPPPSPSAFQPRCLRKLVPPSLSPGQLRRLRGLEEIRRLRAPEEIRRLRAPGQIRRLRAPAQLRHFRALSSSAVSYLWQGPPSPSPQKAPGPGPALVFKPRASSTVSEYSGTRVPIYILSYWTGPAPPPTLKVGRQLPICPLFLRFWCRSFSLASGAFSLAWHD